jgi:putative glutamine amidotransferase
LEKENIKVNSFHHQAINILANDLEACAYSADGIIEAVCVPDHRFCMGVQWHPENFYREDDASMKLFSAFIEACK